VFENMMDSLDREIKDKVDGNVEYQVLREVKDIVEENITREVARPLTRATKEAVEELNEDQGS
jgi:hypothetical protein